MKRTSPSFLSSLYVCVCVCVCVVCVVCVCVQVYKAFLEELQFYGLLAVADVQKIFANLSELVEVLSDGLVSMFRLWCVCL